jgi:hypothetical protein
MWPIQKRLWLVYNESALWVYRFTTFCTAVPSAVSIRSQ